MKLDSAYTPGRLILGTLESSGRATFAVSQEGADLYRGLLGLATSALVLDPGDYVVSAQLGAGSCDQPVTISSSEDAYFTAYFAQDVPNCTWRAGTAFP